MEFCPSGHIKIPPGFWAGLGLLGIPASDVARSAGLPVNLTNASEVTTAEYFAIWQAYAELAGDTAAGIIKLATVFETAKYPPTVLATYHARTYRDALNRMVRYKRLCPPESLRISEEGDQCQMELEWLNTESPGPPLLIGITLAILLELGRRGTGQPLQARYVEFQSPMGEVQELEAYFGCPVRTGTEFNRLTLHRSDLDRPFSSYNEELLEILTPALEETLEEEGRSHSMRERVKWMIKRNLSAGRPEIGLVSRELGLSNRTLQRRLTEEDTSFQRLLTQARQEQAREYLTDPSLDMKEVAFLIGYEDQNSFYRAFRLWEGDTPSHWRAKQIGTQA